jgi:SHS family lactate transporter-like MFS transporter
MTRDAVAAESTFVGAAPAFTFRDVTGVQWHAFLASFFGWMLDGFDFSILTFLLIDIQRSFTVDKALAGMLGTVTLMFRLLGGLGAGTAADRHGRKTPLILCIVWISLFSLLSGFSINYAMLFGCRALFGVGMGGVWAAALPLALEHWPKNLRGVASGMLVGGFNWGYMLAALVFQVLYPVITRHSQEGWRVLFFVAALPVFLVFWIRIRVKESPIWIERRSHLKLETKHEELSVLKIFRRDLIGTTFQTTVLMSVFMFSYYSITFWYPTFLRELSLPPLRYLVALNVGAIIGTALWGRISEAKVGRRGAITLSAIGGVCSVGLFVGSHPPTAHLIGAFLMGTSGVGAWGMAPSYLTERFPTAARAVGPGFAYHAGAAVGSLTPTLIGVLQDRGVVLGTAMGACMAAGGILLAATAWLGPETRGSSFTHSD